MTSGAEPVTSGGVSLLRAYLGIAIFLICIDTINVFTTISDAQRFGIAVPSWRPIVAEVTSGLAEFAVCGIIYTALRQAMPGRVGWGRLISVHALGNIAFSIAHVALMTGMRVGAYSVMGQTYRFHAWEWLYEYRKDVLAYAILGGIFWLLTQPKASSVVTQLPSTIGDRPTAFDIVDGPTVTRVALSSILGVRAAGNYVEFAMGDGRKLLMRRTLTKTETTLAPAGFVRTHRSWIVNISKVRQMTPTGSGDWDLEMVGGIVLPLSRRYPGAQTAIKGFSKQELGLIC